MLVLLPINAKKTRQPFQLARGSKQFQSIQTTSQSTTVHFKKVFFQTKYLTYETTGHISTWAARDGILERQPSVTRNSSIVAPVNQRKTMNVRTYLCMYACVWVRVDIEGSSLLSVS